MRLALAPLAITAVAMPPVPILSMRVLEMPALQDITALKEALHQHLVMQEVTVDRCITTMSPTAWPVRRVSKTFFSYMKRGCIIE